MRTHRSMFFFLKVTATTEIYTYRHTLSLHDALPIWVWTPARMPHDRTWHAVAPTRLPGEGLRRRHLHQRRGCAGHAPCPHPAQHRAACEDPRHRLDRKSTRLNSSH